MVSFLGALAKKSKGQFTLPRPHFPSLALKKPQTFLIPVPLLALEKKTSSSSVSGGQPTGRIIVGTSQTKSQRHRYWSFLYWELATMQPKTNKVNWPSQCTIVVHATRKPNPLRSVKKIVNREERERCSHPLCEKPPSNTNFDTAEILRHLDKGSTPRF